MSALCRSIAHSNTGLVGITETTREGRACFTVSWRAGCRKRKTTTVYWGRHGVTRAMALERAKAIRLAGIARRLRREGRIVPC